MRWNCDFASIRTKFDDWFKLFYLCQSRHFSFLFLETRAPKLVLLSFLSFFRWPIITTTQFIESSCCLSHMLFTIDQLLFFDKLRFFLQLLWLRNEIVWHFSIYRIFLFDLIHWTMSLTHYSNTEINFFVISDDILTEITALYLFLKVRAWRTMISMITVQAPNPTSKILHSSS